jgi:hypothetical protein
MPFTDEQIGVARTIYTVGKQLGVTANQMRAAFAAAWVESRFRNLDYGDRDSLGVFQQRPSQGWGTPSQVMNVEYAARKFFETARTVSQSGTPGQLAQRVQRSAFPSRYDEQIAKADEMLAIVSAEDTPSAYYSTVSSSALDSSIVTAAVLGALLFLLIYE